MVESFKALQAELKDSNVVGSFSHGVLWADVKQPKSSMYHFMLFNLIIFSVVIHIKRYKCGDGAIVAGFCMLIPLVAFILVVSLCKFANR